MATDDVHLPEREFTYAAGQTDRPFQHFKGRWLAMKPILADMLRAFGTARPLRIVDLGSCTGFFALKAAYRHPEADVVGVEGSVGVGNGTAGMQGHSRQILQTPAVQTHLRWIQQLQLTNCFVAPEVWDYERVCTLGTSKKPICDVMFLLSVVHHIDNVSVDQYASAGLSRVAGGIDLIARLLLLSPRHFIEFPNSPWMEALYATCGTAKAILEAAVKATGREWIFKGPIYTAEWFGQRDTWVLEVKDPMPQLDLQFCPFPLLYRGDEAEVVEKVKTTSGDVLASSGDMYGDLSMEIGLQDPFLEGSAFKDPLEGVKSYGGVLSNAALGSTTACQIFTGTLIDPGLRAIAEPCRPVEVWVGAALRAAPASLLLAHLTLREAIAEAQDVLAEVRSQNGDASSWLKRFR